MKTPDSDPISTLGAIERLSAMPDLIRKFSEAIEELEEAGLSRRLLVLMLHDQTKASKKVINQVLDALPLLAETFLTDGD